MSNNAKILPPGQLLTEKFPILHEGAVPQYDLSKWTFKVFGAVDQEKTLNWDAFSSLPRHTMNNDIHCVTTWSRYNNDWEGIYLEDIMNLAQVDPKATHVMIYGYLNGSMNYSSNIEIKKLLGEKSMFAFKHGGKDLSPKHGYPVRFVCPETMYFWKATKWADGIEFMTEDRPGYWEQRGYHMIADPLKEQRFSDTNYKPSGYFGADEWANQSDE
jgi:DMSO/TMAO reductase YedYZ molybdopterin-dependent catalytic subunit